MSNYSYEDRVTWDELAPSVQELFKAIQTQITNISNITNKLAPVVDNLVRLGDTTVTNNIMTIAGNTSTLTTLINNSSSINELINKKDEIINITNVFGGSSMDWSGDPGKIAKTNAKGQLICDDLVYTIRAAGNATDVNTLSGIPLSTKDIFYSWDRISNSEGVTAAKDRQNLLTSEHIQARSAYYYDTGSDTICCNRNSDAWSAFLSNSLYDPNFKLTYAIQTNVQKTYDDDLITCIIGYMVDSNGVFHTLQVHRIGDADTGQHGQRFCLCYDIYTAFYLTSSKGKTANTGSQRTTNVDSKILGYIPYSQLDPSHFYNKYCKISVEKTASTVKCSTSQIVDYSAASSATMSYSFTWTLPSSKPSDWSQEMYDNIKQMMQNPSKIGFGTESNEAAFHIISSECQNIMNVIEIYDLSTGTIKYYDSATGTWLTSKQKAIGDAIQPNSLVYSSYTKKLFYYRRDNNFVEILLS